MDGTFGGGDLISASLAIMLGGTDAELHDKEVTLTTSDVTGSQTAIFEYDPQNEPVSGDPPGPWDGYSLFTIDLSGVKDDIEDLQQQVSDLEDELEACHGCWEDVVAKLQEYDPDYDPDEGECPTEEIEKIFDEKEQEIEALEEQIEECDQCKADVIAKLQEYDPDFDPATCSDIPPEIDKVVEEKEGYKFPEGTPIEDIFPIIGTDQLSGNGVRYTLGCYDYNDVFHEGVLSITYTSDYSSEYYQTWHNRFRPAVAVYYYSGDEEQRVISDATTWWDLTSNWTPRTIKGLDSISTTGVANLICSTHIQSTGEDGRFIANCGSNATAKQKLLEMVSANQYKVKNK